MSLSKFNGAVVLSPTNLADVSTPAGAKTKWNATFTFTDNSGAYLGTQVAVGDAISLDTSAADIGTITTYVVSSVVSSTFNSFRVVMDYVTSNNNPAGAPDVSYAVGLSGAVGRPTTTRGLYTLPSPGIQALPDTFSFLLANDNNSAIDAFTLGSTSSSGIAGGTAGAVVYQSSVNTSGFSAVGTAGQVLVSGGTNAPTWVNQAAIAVSSTSNLSGGTAGGVPYQSASGTTSYLGAGTAGQVLTSGGTGAPTWTSVSSLTVASATNATNSVNVSVTDSAVGATAVYPTWVSATTGNALINTTSTKLSFVPITGILTASGFVGPLTGNVTGTASSLAGGALGSVPYQSGAGTTAFLAAGTAGYLLTTNGAGAPTWTSPAGLTVTNATNATSLSGGTAGGVPYQSASGTTSYLGAGTAGQVLTSGGTAAPTWTSASSLSVSSATTSTNLAGAQWALPYQSAFNTTSMLAAGTSGQVLTSNGSAAPSWQTPAAAPTTATTQAYGDNTTNIATTAFVDRLRSSPTSANTTAALADRGKTILATAGITAPASVFAAGDCFSVYNNSAANITLTSGAGLTLYLVGTATTGNRTLAQRGIATVYYVSATEAVITGGGLT